MYCFSLGMFSGVGAHGNTGGDSGGGSLLGHGHWTSSLEAGTPVLEHLVGLGEVREWMEAVGDLSQEPISGNEAGMRPRSRQTSWDKYVTATWRET